MCGRFTLEPGDDFYDRFNITNQLSILPKKVDAIPGGNIPIIFHENSNVVKLMKWGLIPFWAKDEKIGTKMFNARAETLLAKPSFKKAFKSQRCLVPASSFFEWKTEGKKKIPYLFKIINRPLIALAGLYDVWIDPSRQKEIYSYTIITTSPNDVVGPIHDRMPVILEQKNEQAWLDKSTSTDCLQSLLITSTETMISNIHSFDS